MSSRSTSGSPRPGPERERLAAVGGQASSEYEIWGTVGVIVDVALHMAAGHDSMVAVPIDSIVTDSGGPRPADE